MNTFENLRARRALVLSVLLAACGGQVGGTDSESHFLCRRDQDCERLEGDYACVQGECRKPTGSMSDEPAQQAFPVEPLSCLSYTATLCPDNGLCTPYRAALYDTFNGCLGQERPVACGTAGRSCDNVRTLAMDEYGHCYVFPSSCLPTGWTAASEAVDAAADCQAFDGEAPFCALEPHTCEDSFCAGVSQQAELLTSAQADAGVECQWVLPLPPQGEVFEALQVNVQVEHASGVLHFPFVEDPARCDDANGWYYDDLAAPTRLILCSSACIALLTIPDARVSIYIGCSTLIPGGLCL